MQCQKEWRYHSTRITMEVGYYSLPLPTFFERTPLPCFSSEFGGAVAATMAGARLGGDNNGGRWVAWFRSGGGRSSVKRGWVGEVPRVVTGARWGVVGEGDRDSTTAGRRSQQGSKERALTHDHVHLCWALQWGARGGALPTSLLRREEEDDIAVLDTLLPRVGRPLAAPRWPDRRCRASRLGARGGAPPAPLLRREEEDVAVLDPLLPVSGGALAAAEARPSCQIYGPQPPTESSSRRSARSAGLEGVGGGGRRREATKGRAKGGEGAQGPSTPNAPITPGEEFLIFMLISTLINNRAYMVPN
jgi:hypothetical protein